MPGVNLSQLRDEEEQEVPHSFFDTGIIVSFIVLVLTSITWGGLQLYIGSIDKKLVAVDMTLQTFTDRLKGPTIDRIADFDARLSYFSTHREGIPDLQDIMQRLERGVAPGVLLTRFKYDHETRTAVVEGNCVDFRKLAEQMMSFKGEGVFSQVVVQSIDRSESERIVFSLKVSF